VCVCDLWYDDGPGRIIFIEPEDQAFLNAVHAMRPAAKGSEVVMNWVSVRLKWFHLITWMRRPRVEPFMHRAVHACCCPGSGQGIIYSQGTLCPRDA
jgi:hypothetical protein